MIRSCVSGNDIAVLKFEKPLRWSNKVRPACIPNQNDVIPTHCTVAGWGDTDQRPTGIVTFLCHN